MQGYSHEVFKRCRQALRRPGERHWQTDGRLRDIIRTAIQGDQDSRSAAEAILQQFETSKNNWRAANTIGCYNKACMRQILAEHMNCTRTHMRRGVFDPSGGFSVTTERLPDFFKGVREAIGSGIVPVAKSNLKTFLLHQQNSTNGQVRDHAAALIEKYKRGVDLPSQSGLLGGCHDKECLRAVIANAAMCLNVRRDEDAGTPAAAPAPPAAAAVAAAPAVTAAPAPAPAAAAAPAPATDTQFDDGTGNQFAYTDDEEEEDEDDEEEEDEDDEEEEEDYGDGGFAYDDGDGRGGGSSVASSSVASSSDDVLNRKARSFLDQKDLRIELVKGTAVDYEMLTLSFPYPNMRTPGDYVRYADSDPDNAIRIYASGVHSPVGLTAHTMFVSTMLICSQRDARAVFYTLAGFDMLAENGLLFLVTYRSPKKNLRYPTENLAVKGRVRGSNLSHFLYPDDWKKSAKRAFQCAIHGPFRKQGREFLFSLITGIVNDVTPESLLEKYLRKRPPKARPTGRSGIGLRTRSQT